MITLSRSYTVGDQTFASLELAQQYEIITLLKAEAGTNDIIGIATAAQVLVGNKSKVLDILSFRNKGRPRGRASNKIQRMGGIARANALTSSERIEISRHAAKTRWESDPNSPREPAKESAKAPETAKAV